MEARGSCENAPCQGLLLQGADLIPLVLVPNRVQRLQGCMEGTVCTTIFTAFQAPNKLPSQENTLHSALSPSCSASQRPQEQPLVYDNKAGAMATHCDVMGV